MAGTCCATEDEGLAAGNFNSLSELPLAVVVVEGAALGIAGADISPGSGGNGGNEGGASAAIKEVKEAA
jgi:hypothetical protein